MSNGRFVHPAALDDGDLLVSPAPRQTPLPISESTASDLFGSDTLVNGASHSGELLGFGLVSVRPSLVAGLRSTPAWVGLTWGAVVNCPYATPGTGQSGPNPPTPGYLAVIIVGTGTRVLDYTSRTSTCNSAARGPSVTPALRLWSIPWDLVSFNGSTVVYRFQKPTCVPPSASSQIRTGGTAGGTSSLMIVYPMPYDLAGCGTVWTTGSAPVGPPPGPGAPQPGYTGITHGPTGPLPS